MNAFLAMYRPPRRQRGISLLVVMTLLLVTSVLGIVILRSGAMQERMSANMRDRSIAFQSAEAALRFAQSRLAILPDTGNAERRWDQPSTVPTAEECTNLGICDARDPANPPPVVFMPFTGAQAAAEYRIEYLGPAKCSASVDHSTDTTAEGYADNSCPLYRITARSGSPGRAEVMLQTNVLNGN